MIDPTTVKVNGRFQITIPSHVRQQLKIQAGDKLLVDVQDGLLIFAPQPADYVTYMAGLHQDVWHGIDTTAYLNDERTAWQNTIDD